MIPARGGSKGIPDKVLRPVAGLPLLVHAIEVARRSPAVGELLVSTDSERIAAVARDRGVEVPWLRPDELALDETPMWPVVRHALAQAEADGSHFDAVLVLQPTSPARLPEDVARAVSLLATEPAADGVLGVSRPSQNPISTAMVLTDRWLTPLVSGGDRYTRRQDVPEVLTVNGNVFLWRTELLRSHEHDPGAAPRYLPLEIPALRAIDVDTEDDLALADLVVERLVRPPWIAA